MKRYVIAIAAAIFCAGSPVMADTTAPQSEEVRLLDQKIVQLQQERDIARRQAYIASDRADRALTQDWLGYKRALQQQAYYEERVQELDAQIEKLQQQRTGMAR